MKIGTTPLQAFPAIDRAVLAERGFSCLHLTGKADGKDLDGAVLGDTAGNAVALALWWRLAHCNRIAAVISKCAWVAPYWPRQPH